MASFYDVYSIAQQFNLLQAYADNQLSEVEKMNFFLEKSTDNEPLLITEKGLYVITPAVDFSQFSHTFIPKLELDVDQVGTTVTIGDYTLAYDTEAETQATYEDITFLFSDDN